MNHRDPRATRAVLILATVLFLWFLWGHDLWAPEEPTYGEITREMLVDGQWLVPHVLGETWTDKPPLFFWLIAFLSLPFGQVLEFTARLPSVIAAIGTLALTMRIGLKWYGPRTAALAGVILSTAYMFWDKARFCQPESLLTFLIWLALVAFIEARENDDTRRLIGAVFWISLSLTLLVKWLVGLVIVLGIVVVTLAVDRRPALVKHLTPVSGLFIMGGIVGAWVVAVALWGPDDYSVWGAMEEQFFQRGMKGMHHIAPPWYYLTSLPVSLLPWAGLLPGALLLGWRRRVIPGDRFLLITVLCIVGLYSISPEKRELYLLPTFPAISLMMANLVATVGRWPESNREAPPSIHRRWATAGQGVVGTLMLLVGVALPIAGRQLNEVPYWTVVSMAALLLGMAGAMLWYAIRGLVLKSVLATAAGTALVYLFVAAVVFPILDPVKSDRVIAQRTAILTAESRAAGYDVAAFRTRNLPKTLAFYSDGLYTWEIWDLEELERHLSQDATVFAVLYSSDLAEIRPRVMKRVEIVARAPHSRREVLLISNTRKPDRLKATN